MKLTLAQDKFAAGLGNVSRAVSSKSTIPVLSGILLEGTTDSLILRATDLEVAVECRVEASVQLPGAVVLPARFLSELVRKIPFGDIEVTVDPANFVATLRWAKSEYTMHGFSADQFPQRAQPGKGTPLKASHQAMRELIRQTSFAVAHDDTRPYLGGVNFLLGSKQLRAIATDSVRIAYSHIPVETEDEVEARAIVPGRSLTELGRLLSAESENPIQIFMDENQIEFQLGETTLVSRLLEGQYPDVMRLVPQNYPMSARVPRSSFVEAMERAALLAKDGAVKISIQPNSLAITANTPEVGQVYEEIPCSSQGDPLEIGFNSRYVLDGIRPMEDGDFLFEFSGNRNPSRIRSADGAPYLYIVLPLITY